MRIIATCLLLLFAGCITPSVTSDPDALASAVPRLHLHDAVATDTALLWEGKKLQATGVQEGSTQNSGFRIPRPACDETNCERVAFRVEGPARVHVAVNADDTDRDYRAVSTGNPAAGMDYLGDTTFYFSLRVFDADGELAGVSHDSLHQGSVTVIEGAHGDYVAEVLALADSAGYRGSIRIVTDEEIAAHRGLPDLVLLPPAHILITTPLGRDVASLLDPIARGCGPDEVSDTRALRCLRYDTRILNLGPGDFEERLSMDQYSASLGQQSAHWSQRITHADGSIEEIPSGPAVYHPVHGHFHLNGLQKAFIYSYDAAAQSRGELAAEGQKTGLCMVDGGIIDLSGVVVAPNPRDNGCCYMAVFCPLDMAEREDFVHGISPGWFDTYPWWRADQYVDITGLVDGTYELVVVVNPDHVVREMDTTNNEASVVFTLVGDQATIVTR